jgi:uncharacterized RmlC-like cupin family protein
VPDQNGNNFSQVKTGDTKFVSEGLRDFFLHRDLGIAEATSGKVIAQQVKAKFAPEDCTGWHHHVAVFHIVYMFEGWARLMYGTEETLVAAGNCVRHRPNNGRPQIIFHIPSHQRIAMKTAIRRTSQSTNAPKAAPVLVFG